jgi:hypothetical protein
LDVMIGTGCYHGLWSMLRSDNQELNFLWSFVFQEVTSIRTNRSPNKTDIYNF